MISFIPPTSVDSIGILSSIASKIVMGTPSQLKDNLIQFIMNIIIIVEKLLSESFLEKWHSIKPAEPVIKTLDMFFTYSLRLFD